MRDLRHTLAAALAVALLASPLVSRQQTGNNLAPGAPGADARWPSAGKEAVGSSNTLESKVWFTLRGGVLDEVYYPTVDVANSQVLQFVVASRDGRSVETEERDTSHRIEVLDPQSLTFRQTNTAGSGAYTITKTYVADPERSTVLIDVEFASRGGAGLYVYFDPSLNNSGMHDSAWTEGGALLASDADKASALASSVGFEAVANGYLGTESDGLLRLTKGDSRAGDARAADGNVVQLARVPQRGGRFTLALGFGREPSEALGNARASLGKGFAEARAEYERGWHEYVRSLRRVGAKYQPQFDMAAMILKAHEDKTYRGAMIASLSVPWGGGASANEPVVGGYHLVWSRDLYQVATAFHALGDKASADRALDYLFRVQQKPDGSFPQNSWLDGRPFWGSLQLDEVAYPLVLALRLGRTDNETYTKHVRPAADFILRHGPYTPQERWEEESGYSPSTIAAEIAGLVSAAEIARRHGDEASAAVYLAAADEWTRNVEAWTATTNGVYGDGNYYLRITEDDDPNDGEPRELNNGAGTFDERAVVDAGFLELVRLGIKPAGDPLVAKSVAVIDQVIRVETPNGPGFYRYNHDGYGEMDDGRPWNWDGKYTGRGRLWALLSGERGQYELARGEREAAVRRLDAMLGFANEGRMLPEQVWDKRESPRPDLRFGEGTGSATPLAWSSAQFIRLAANLQEGRNLDTPEHVAARYVRQPPPARAGATFHFPAPEVLDRFAAGERLRVAGRAPKGTRAFLVSGGERRELSFDAQGATAFEVDIPRGETHVFVGVVGPGGATSFQRARVRGLSAEELRRAEQELYPPELFERAKSAETTPLVDNDSVIFVYRGPAKRVEVVGDFTNWGPAGLVLRGTGDTKLLKLEFPAGARLEYKLIADGEWLLDPLNPQQIDNGVGGFNSFFTTGTVAAPPAEATESAGAVVGEVQSRILGGTRQIAVYLPPGYRESDERYPVLYLQDGREYLRRANAAAAAERLVREKKVRPFIIVFVNPADRAKEYRASDAFADFMAKELVPYVDSKYRTRPERDGRALLGASLGGVISVWTALRHPEVFARVGGQSTAFQIDDERVVRRLSELAEAPRSAHPFRFYFDAGLYEAIYGVNRRVQVMLAAKGYPVTYRETPSGHNYTTWRTRLPDAYTALWAE
jgi:glucoamylase